MPTRGLVAAVPGSVLVLLAACGGGPKPAPSPVPASAPPRTTPSPEAPAPSAGGAPTDAAMARFAYVPGAYRYEVRTDATVELAGTRERESVGTSARVIYTVARGTRAGVVTMTGAVDSIALRASARVAAGAADVRAAVVPFRATVDASARATAAGTRIELVDGVPRCAVPDGAAEGSALAAAREAVVRVPAAIPVGARWRDSVTTAGCSGEIPTVVTSVVRYEVIGGGGARFGGAEGVRVRREVTTTTRGQGIARGRPVVVVGSGAGEGSVYLDPVGGRVLGVEGEVRSTVRVTVGRDPAQEFAQRTQLRVRLLP